MQALGLIETRGLLPAVACADIMLKTAQVELVGKTFVGGGLVTVGVTGDVGAVKAAVAAGVTAVERFGPLSLVAQHIIPRPYQEIDCIVAQPRIFSPSSEPTMGINQSLPQQKPPPEAAEPARDSAASIKPVQIMLPEFRKAGVDAAVANFGLEKSVAALQAFSVERLRNLAREYKALGIAGRAISKANKDLLIQKLREYYERGSSGSRQGQ